MIASEITDRVEREKMSHGEDDVLSRAYALKDRFSHIWSVTDRVRNAENLILSKCQGAKVLDYGCGRGEYSLKLLELGAIVEGIDISQQYIDIAKSACQDKGYGAERFHFQVMDAHRLEFADDTFDYVVGNGILHHLDYPTALSEINRVLKPGGRAIFQEPLAGNPLLAILRFLTPSARTVDERPFRSSDLKAISRDWQVENSYFGLFSAPVACFTSLVFRPWPNNILIKAATKLEEKLIDKKLLESWNQYVLFNLVKN